MDFLLNTCYDDEDDFILFNLPCGAEKIINSEHHNTDVIEKYSDKEFLEHFRLNRDKVDYLIERFNQNEIFSNLSSQGRETISAKLHILIFLSFAGHQTSSYRDICERFNISLSTLRLIIYRVASFLGVLSKEIIKWPCASEKEEIKAHYTNRGFPNVLGCIDSCLIKIDKPGKYADNYMDSNGNFSIKLQGVCNNKKLFTDIFVGYPGFVHDNRVFTNSFLYRDLTTKCQGGILLGDSAYACLTHVITPYRNRCNMTNAQKQFNIKLNKCRIDIEHTFGILKQRFPQLYHIKLRDVSLICKFIRACCVLHNIASEDEFFDQDIPVEDSGCEGESDEDMEEVPQSGTSLREEILNRII